MKIGLLCSGELGKIVLNGMIDTGKEIVTVLTDKGSGEIADICNQNAIPVFVGNPRKGDAALFLSAFKIDLLLSVNYLFLVKKDVYGRAEIAVNFHGSLLPKYRGRTPHVWAIINNEDTTGITAHIIDDGCDTGDILLQKEIPIDMNDTGASILKKYNAAYPEMIEAVITMIDNNEVIRNPQDNEAATYFGKRAPEDGCINWNWQKERIRNWVRAQADPYPGAFTFYNGKKITIDEISFENSGFSFDIPNGTIMSIRPDITVKTPNGVIRIVKRRDSEPLIKGSKFQDDENRKF